ncbi:MAG: hypothetical protein WAS73_04655 [Defluviicoccus sp.]
MTTPRAIIRFITELAIEHDNSIIGVANKDYPAASDRDLGCGCPRAGRRAVKKRRPRDNYLVAARPRRPAIT